MVEQRYQAVLAVIADGRTVSQVAGQWSVSRQTIAGAALLGVLGCDISACGSSSTHRELVLTNNTASVVRVNNDGCLPYTAPRCAPSAKTLAPNQSMGFPLSSNEVGSTPALLVITGYGNGARCFVVPPAVRSETFRANVTDASSEACDGRVPRPSP